MISGKQLQPRQPHGPKSKQKHVNQFMFANGNANPGNNLSPVTIVKIPASSSMDLSTAAVLAGNSTTK